MFVVPFDAEKYSTPVVVVVEYKSTSGMLGGIHFTLSATRLFPLPLFVTRYGLAGFLSLVRRDCQGWQEKRAEETVHARMASHDL
jgi:hypothetical protein